LTLYQFTQNMTVDEFNDNMYQDEHRHQQIDINQRAASSVVFSDLCNLNRTVYLYAFSCISLFLCTIIHLARHQSLIHTEFCITTVELPQKIIYVHFL
jgi:hypothetical protein